MLSHLSNTQKGILLAFAGYTGFAWSDVTAKYLVQSYNVYQVIAIDSFFAAIFFLMLSPVLTKGTGKFRVQKPWLHALRAVMNFLATVFIVLAIAKLPLATAYTMVFIKPFLAALLTIPLYKEKVPLSRWLVIFAGFGGIVVAMHPGGDSFTPLMFLPMLTALCAAVMFIVSKSLEGENSFALGFYPAIGTSLLAVPFMISSYEPVAFMHWFLFMIGGAGVAAGILGITLAFRMAPSAAVSPMHYTQIIWGLVFGFIIFSDVPDLWTLVGAAIIIVSGVYLLETERREQKAASTH